MSAAASPASALLARQPIFDDRSHVFGYELLYRGPEIAAEDFGAVATARVLCEALTELGLQRVVADGQMFINFDQHLLEHGAAELLPTGRAVVEVLEHVIATPELARLIQALRNGGVRIALDDFLFQEHLLPLLPLADFVKVDVLAAEGTLPDVAARLLALGLPLIAEKVETRKQFQHCRELGFRYFQGYYFARPESLTQARMAPGQLAILQLLTELNRPDCDSRQLAHVIGRDVRLAHHILRLANSAAYRRRRELKSIADAATVLGQETLRQCASLLLLAQLPGNKPQELLTLAMTRGKLCECVAAAEPGSDPGAAFTVGLLSVLDALLDRDMGAILDELALAPELRAALLGDRGQPLGAILARAQAYEQGDWSAIGLLPTGPGLSLARAYTGAIEMADVAFSARAS